AEQRAQKLQEMMNAFQKEHGLPPTNIEVFKDSGAGIGGGYGDGKISLPESALMGDPKELIEKLYHEGVHNGQDSLVIRKLADELKIGKEPTAEQIQKLQELYKTSTNGELSEGYLKDVLKIRDGKPLSAEELARAELAEKAFKEDPMRSGKLEQLASEYKAVNGEMQKFFDLSKNPGASEDLVKKMSEDPELTKKLFGGEPPENVKQLIEAYKAGQSGEKFPKAQADKVLSEQLSKRNKELNEAIDAALTQYKKNANEQ